MLKEVECTRYTQHISCHVTALCLQNTISSTYLDLSDISDHLSHAQGKWLVYFSFTKLKLRPNIHVTAATAHYHVSKVTALVLEIYQSYYHLLIKAFMQILNWLEEQIKLLFCLNHSTQHDHPKYSTLN